MSHSDLSTQRVLIFGDSILEEGVANLLKDGVDLHVSSAKYSDDLAFLAEIAEKRPDVIVLHESTPRNTAHLLKLLFSIDALADLRVIVIRLSDNMLDVYEMSKRAVEGKNYKQKKFNVTKPGKLMKVVRG
jgi:hypothetical protein